MDDALKQALEDASKKSKTNEELISIGIFIAALPGLIKFSMGIVEKIAKKNKIDLTKKNNPSWYTVVKNIATKIDDYLDTPIRTVLRLFISDEQERNKIAKIIKAIVLVVAGSFQSFDPSNVQDISSTIKDLVPDLAGDFIRTMVDKNSNTVNSIIQIVKQHFNS